jgi:cell division protein FtsB
VRILIKIPRPRPRKLVTRQRGKRSAQTTLIIALVAVFGSLYALFGSNGLMAVMRMRARATQLQYEIAEQERANHELMETIKPLREGDPEAIEKLAREKLQMARPGDTIYLLPPETRPNEPALNEAASPTAPPTTSRR